MGNFPRASFNAFTAASTLFEVNGDGAGFIIYAKGFEWTGFNTWIIFALRAEVRKFRSRN